MSKRRDPAADFFAYMNGWRDGAGVRGHQRHDNADMQPIYDAGYRDGQIDARAAQGRAEQRFGYRQATIAAKETSHDHVA